MSSHNVMHTHSAFLLSTVVGLTAPAIGGEPAMLDIALTSGQNSTIVPQGGTFNVRVTLSSDKQLEYNAALFRIVVSVEASQVIYYNWSQPFETGGFTDFSLEGLSLPATILDETLSGPGYPLATADVEFGNFDPFTYATDGPVIDIVLRAPVDAVPGSTFFVVAVPDLFSNGFDLLDVDVGSLLTVQIANSGVLGDISGDSVVDSNDLAILLGNWGTSGPGDLDSSGVIDSADLAILIGVWS